MNELKPCPFCGEPKQKVLYSISYGVPSGDPGYKALIRCTCGANVERWALKKAWAIASVKKAWNRRDVQCVGTCRNCDYKIEDGNGHPYCTSLEMYLADELDFYCASWEPKEEKQDD